jgi:predicted RNA-binding protein
MSNPRYFLLIGDKDTWLVSISLKIWGFSEKSKGFWNRSYIGDYVAFYVTLPIGRVIGHGRITNKFISENLIWPDEKMFGKSIWPYKIEFEKRLVIDEWDQGIPVPRHILLNTGRKVVSEDTFLNIIQQFKTSSN